MQLDVFPEPGLCQVEDDSLWYCHRGRNWKIAPDCKLITSDVWLLGEKLDRLASAVQEMVLEFYPPEQEVD